MKKGLFITLEGGEGAGKSTCLAFVQDWLAGQGHEVVVTREPGGTPLGEKLRNLLLHGVDPISSDTELLLMFAARAQHLASIIRPAIKRGACVVCDRFTDATYAYQGGGRGVPHHRIQALEEWVQQGLKPDLTLLLDIPVTLGLLRAGQRSEPDRFEREKQDFLERVRMSYLNAATREPVRIKLIQANDEIQVVQEQIRSILEKLLS